MPEIEVALYKNSKGANVTHSSYSSRQTFKHCPRQFQLERIDGWSDKTQRAAPVFGKAIEAAVQYYETQGRAEGTGVTKFVELWEQAKLDPDFKEWQYTGSEGSWEQLLQSGKDMLLLYAIRAPFLPISTHPAALWQQVLRKKLFPGTQYDKLENKAVVDIFSFPRWDHPLLPKIDAPDVRNQGFDVSRSLIIDMKTSGEDLNTELVKLDPQLGEYAWQARVPDVAFLWFVKKSPEFKKDSRITLLQDVGEYHAGFELLVLFKQELMVAMGTPAIMGEYEKAVDGLTGKALAAAKANFTKREGVVTHYPSTFTKQRLQFQAVRLSQAEMDDVGRNVAQSTIEMVRAHQEQYYPQLAGVRFPNQKCTFCSMRWICLGNSEKRDANLTKRGEEWLDGIYEEKDTM